jgi:hypothetical protein
MTASETSERTLEGIHCTLTIRHPSRSVIVLRIDGTDVGEFGQEPMKLLDEWLAGSDNVDFFIGVSALEGMMWACTESEVFDAALANSLRPVTARSTLVQPIP